MLIDYFACCVAGKEVLGHLKKDWQPRDWVLQEGVKKQKRMQLKSCRNLENATFYAHFPDMYIVTSLYTDLLIRTT